MPATESLTSDTVAALSPEARAHWKLTGEIDPKATAPAPDAPAEGGHSLSTEAASSPAEPAAQAEEIASPTTPASEPGTPRKKSNAETRVQELLAENKRLKALAERSAPPPAAEAARPAADARPEPSPVTAATTTLASFIDAPDLTKAPLSDVEFFTQFPKANTGDFTDYRLNYRQGLTDRQAAATRQFDTLHTQYHERVDPVVAADPQIWDKLPTEFRDAKPTGITLETTDRSRTAWNDLAREIFVSPKAGELMTYFAAHPEEMSEIAALPNENSVIKAVARIEARIDSDSVPSRPVVRPRTTTSAPPPGTTLGRRTANPPVSDAKAAVANRDMGNYKAIMNAKDVAARQGGSAR
jgi:hypothetical protein